MHLSRKSCVDFSRGLAWLCRADSRRNEGDLAMENKDSYIYSDGLTFGPIPINAIRIMLQQKIVHSTEFVWSSVMQRWERIIERPEFSDALDLPPYPDVPVPYSEEDNSSDLEKPENSILHGDSTHPQSSPRKYPPWSPKTRSAHEPPSTSKQPLTPLAVSANSEVEWEDNTPSNPGQNSHWCQTSHHTQSTIRNDKSDTRLAYPSTPR